MNVQTETRQPTITITPAAAAQIKRLMKRRGEENVAVRIGVKGGGCSGLSYVLSLDENVNANDHRCEIEGMQVVVDPKSARFLDGLTLDYSLKNLMEGGWVFQNPNAARSCGCGTSFTPK